MSKQESKIIKAAGWVITRAGFFYLIGFFMLSSIIDFDSVWKASQLRSLNRIMPLFDGIVEFSMNAQALSAGEWEEYGAYYQNVAELRPYDGAAFFLLAFCQAQMGEEEKASQNFRQAVALNPELFWFDYNLAMSLYNQGNYAAAASWLRTAVVYGADPVQEYIIKSTLYLQIIANRVLEDYNFRRSFNASFARAHLVMAKCLYLSGKYKEASDVIYYSFSKGIAYDRDFYMIAALSLEKEKRYAEAVDVLKAGLDRYPTDIHLLTQLKTIFGSLGRFSESKKIQTVIDATAKVRPPLQDLFSKEEYRLF